MKKYLVVAFGGMLGSILRYEIKTNVVFDVHNTIPFDTLFINIMGSFLIGFILTTIGLRFLKQREVLKLGIITGFLGGFTTFSTFCKEVANIMLEGKYYYCFLYIIISIILGLAVTYFGVWLAKKVSTKDVNNKILVVGIRKFREGNDI